MREIRLEELPEWYSEKVRKQVEPPRRKVQKIIEKIQLALSDISASCDSLSDVTTV